MRKPTEAERVAFQAIFKTPLHQFWHPMFGFDVIVFDRRVIKPNDDESTSDAITRKYGAEATRLVESLIQS